MQFFFFFLVTEDLQNEVQFIIYFIINIIITVLVLFTPMSFDIFNSFLFIRALEMLQPDDLDHFQNEKVQIDMSRCAFSGI